MKIFIITILLALISLTCSAKSTEKKLAEDPTKVVTKFGVGYSNNFDFDSESVLFSGSLALDEARKVNARIKHDGSEWSFGGSWLFDLGIVNFRFAKNELDNGATQNSYSIGTFVPLSYFGLEPKGIQIFPMAGYTYNDGESLCYFDEQSYEACGLTETPGPNNGYALISSTNHSGYLGAFVLKPLTQQWTLIGFAGGSLGSDDYSGYWGGIGAGYSFNKQHSLSLHSHLSDSSFGDESGIGLNYTYEF